MIFHMPEHKSLSQKKKKICTGLMSTLRANSLQKICSASELFVRQCIRTSTALSPCCRMSKDGLVLSGYSQCSVKLLSLE